MLPKTAMPSAPPNSAHVAEMPEAAPARSGGADPMMTSFVRVKSGDAAGGGRREAGGGKRAYTIYKEGRSLGEHAHVTSQIPHQHVRRRLRRGSEPNPRESARRRRGRAAQLGGPSAHVSADERQARRGDRT